MLAKKSYGQHFLRDESVVQKILSALDLSSGETLVEIGPGTGALTEHLALKAQGRFILIEADRDLVPELRRKFPSAEIIEADAALVDYQKIVGAKSWVLVGNLPYNAANAIIMNALTSPRPPQQLVVMVQREVGERMLAKPGEMSLLSVAVQVYAEVRRVCTVKPGAFVPPPKVDSVVLDLHFACKVKDPEKIIALAKVGFANRRKQLHRNLAEAGLFDSLQTKKKLEQMGLSPQARAQELSIENWRDFVI